MHFNNKSTTLTRLIMLFITAILYLFYAHITPWWLFWRLGKKFAYKSSITSAEFTQPPKPSTRFRKKPEWVKQKVIRLKALCPHNSLRDIAHQFNRMELQRSNESVSHTWVSTIIKQHRYEISCLQKTFRKQRPKPIPLHHTWAVDITFLPDQNKKPQAILGIIEHHSRACLSLTTLRTKASIDLLRLLANTIELTQAKAKHLRTDNEPVFTSRLFRFGLALAGIKHQTTELASPWQNGRIERFFGTFKEKARGLVFNTQEELQQHLNTFNIWYNHLRPHQYLNYRTPMEAYHQGPIHYAKPNSAEPHFLSAWNNRLTGFYIQRE